MSKLLDVMRWGRAARLEQTTEVAAADRPTCDPSSVTAKAGGSHVFTRPEFSVATTGGRSLVHLRIQSSGGSGVLSLDGVAVRAGQLVTVRDLYAGGLRWRHNRRA